MGDELADEALSPRTKPIDVEQTNDLSVLVEIGRDMLRLLKCILGLISLVLVVTVYIAARLP